MSQIKTTSDFSRLTGPQKAAMLLLALPEEKIGKVFEQMDDQEIREISQAMSDLGKVTSDVVENVFVDFSEQISSTGSLIGTFESTERLLSKVLSKDRVGNIMEEIRGPAGRTMWDKLGNVNEDILANYLKNEYPQTIAVVLSRIKQEHAAKVLSLLPETMSMEVVMRMLRMESVQREVVDQIEKTLRTEFMSNLARSMRKDTYESVAEIFNYLERNVETKFMGMLEERNPESAERIKALMFTFEDLQRVDNAGIQGIIRTADKTKLALALKGAGEHLKEMFFRNMSERAAKLMKDDMASMGMVKLKDVDEAQAAVVAIAKDLSQRGEITIASPNDEGDQLIG